MRKARKVSRLLFLLFIILSCFEPTRAMLQTNRTKQPILRHDDTLSLPHLQYCQEGDDDYQARMLISNQLCQKNTGAFSQQPHNLSNAFANGYTSQQYQVRAI